MTFQATTTSNLGMGANSLPLAGLLPPQVRQTHMPDSRVKARASFEPMWSRTPAQRCGPAAYRHCHCRKLLLSNNSLLKPIDPKRRSRFSSIGARARQRQIPQPGASLIFLSTRIRTSLPRSLRKSCTSARRHFRVSDCSESGTNLSRTALVTTSSNAE